MESVLDWHNSTSVDGSESYTLNSVSVGLASIPVDDIRKNGKEGADKTWEMAKGRKLGWSFHSGVGGKIILTELWDFEMPRRVVSFGSSLSHSIPLSSSLFFMMFSF